MVDSVEVHNNRVWTYLDANGYSESKKEFQSDLLTEIKRIKKLYDFLMRTKNKWVIWKMEKSEQQNYTELGKLSDERYEFLLIVLI